MTLLIIICCLMPFLMKGAAWGGKTLALHHNRKDIEREWGEPGSAKWMNKLLEPGNLQRIAALEHAIDQTPDFDTSVMGLLADSPYHPKECNTCTPETQQAKIWNGHHDVLHQWNGKAWVPVNGPAITNTCAKCGRTKPEHSFFGKCLTAEQNAKIEKQIRKNIEAQRKLMVLPPATYQSEPTQPAPAKNGTLSDDTVILSDSKGVRALSTAPGEVKTRAEIDNFLKLTEQSPLFLTVNKMPKGVPQDAHVSLRQTRGEPHEYFLMYKWNDDSHFEHRPLYHIRYVVLDDNKNNRRRASTSTGPR